MLRLRTLACRSCDGSSANALFERQPDRGPEWADPDGEAEAPPGVPGPGETTTAVTLGSPGKQGERVVVPDYGANCLWKSD